jgi:N-acetylglutamate synthase/N-acetylornithine aminotransferase
MRGDYCLQVTIGGKPVHIGGMCKGSGMIHPNMATMLGIVTCDAAVDPAVWRDMLRRACEASFNAVSGTLHVWMLCPSLWQHGGLAVAIHADN